MLKKLLNLLTNRDKKKALAECKNSAESLNSDGSSDSKYRNHIVNCMREKGFEYDEDSGLDKETTKAYRRISR